MVRRRRYRRAAPKPWSVVGCLVAIILAPLALGSALFLAWWAWVSVVAMVGG